MRPRRGFGRAARRGAILLLLSATIFSGCSRRPSTAFSGIWIKTDENNLANLTVQNVVYVSVEGKRFQIYSKGNGMELLQIYTGKELLTRRSATEAPEIGVPVDSASVNATTPTVVTGPLVAEPMTDKAARALCFWINSEHGASEPGGFVAARPTRLFHSESKKGDTLIQRHVWVDVVTGVVLRSSVAVYSSTARSLIVRTIYDCTHITYGAGGARRTSP